MPGSVAIAESPAAEGLRDVCRGVAGSPGVCGLLLAWTAGSSGGLRDGLAAAGVECGI